MPENPWTEKREHRRIEASVPVDITFIDNTTGDPVAPAVGGKLINISVGGLCTHVHPPDVKHALEQTLTGTLLIRARVQLGEVEDSIFSYMRVAWCEKARTPAGGYKMGLAFEQISDTDRDMLERFIESQAK